MDSRLSRRAVLGGVAAGVSAAWLAPTAAPASPPGLVALRRDLHRHPEASGFEERTAAVVAQRLRAAGLDVVTGVGGHGVVAVLDGGRPGRTVAYRADMDATTDGTSAAHLCGHDVHTTMGVGIAQVLARRRARFAGRVVFLFQPAEETLAGAAAMIADGVLDRWSPAEIHALHCGPFPVGRFAVLPGVGFPGLDRGTATTATAEQAVALAAGIAALSTVSRPVTPAETEQYVTDLQTPDGPLARFVFATARAAGTQVHLSYRCWPADRHAELRDTIRRLAAATGATVDFPSDPFPALVCPARDALVLQQFLRRTVGADRTLRLHAALPFNGEDFALFLNRMPGTYTFLGVRRPGASIESSAPHHPAFDPDERAIGHGVRTMAAWLTERCQGAIA